MNKNLTRIGILTVLLGVLIGISLITGEISAMENVYHVGDDGPAGGLIF